MQKTGTSVFVLLLANGLLLSGHYLPALAQDSPTEGEILRALTPKTEKRGLSPKRPQAAENQRFIDGLRSRTAHALTVEEREKLAEIAKARPSIDLQINFDFDSATVGPHAMPALLALGRALSNNAFKGAVFLIDGHTDAKGGAEYNQDLSERRAEAVKRLLAQQFGLPADALIAVGYGMTRLKKADDALAGENRRVQVVNMSGQ